jgi:hypothetical protein
LLHAADIVAVPDALVVDEPVKDALAVADGDNELVVEHVLDALGGIEGELEALNLVAEEVGVTLDEAV